VRVSRIWLSEKVQRFASGSRPPFHRNRTRPKKRCSSPSDRRARTPRVRPPPHRIRATRIPSIPIPNTQGQPIHNREQRPTQSPGNPARMGSFLGAVAPLSHGSFLMSRFCSLRSRLGAVNCFVQRGGLLDLTFRLNRRNDAIRAQLVSPQLTKPRFPYPLPDCAAFWGVFSST